MKRNVSLAEISDGRLYKASDMVKADCGGCNGCSRCCHGMGNSIILDPYDVYHSFRPGFCRLFPLGRYYENGGFSYFLQTGECAKENRSKIKVSKWIDTPDLTRNQQFTLQWHDLLHAMEERLTGEDEGKQQEENLLLLRLFYLLPYKGTTDFYSQFMERMEYWNEQIR